MWRLIVNKRGETITFVREIPDGVMEEFRRRRGDGMEYLRKALDDERIAGHGMTICEPEWPGSA